MALIFSLHSLLYSGVSSPDTIYSIAPAANAKLKASVDDEILPKIEPNKAPTPVAIPDKNTYNNIFEDLIPDFFMGAAMDIPSGMS